MSTNYLQMTGNEDVVDGYNSIMVNTNGSAREIGGVDGTGFADGDEMKFINNGPETLTLLHNHNPAGDGNRLFLPGGLSRTLGANGKPYWMVRNSAGPLGDGWY